MIKPPIKYESRSMHPLADGRPPYEIIAYYINDKSNAAIVRYLPNLDNEAVVKKALRNVLESRKKPPFPSVSIKDLLNARNPGE